jgi:alkanesulfonate monooxygenase SsuD/methylene tetrahydromethanopterin reductase-like flavin-dependent oxidoreductase (luciferase family)
MRALWRDQEASFEGHFWQFEGVPMEPKPLQKPTLPVWFGARAASAVQRAVRLGDGFMGAGSASSHEFIQQVGWIRQYLEETGREPGTFPISKRVYIAVDADRRRAELRLREWFNGFYGNADLAARVSVFGSRHECLDRLGELVEGGAQHLMLNPVFDELDQMEILAAEVVPEL